MDNAIVIESASTQPYLSIGIRFGGITFKNKVFVYIQEHDSYLRKDFVTKWNKFKKERKSWKEFIEYVKTV
jgi:hypothetical protein